MKSYVNITNGSRGEAGGLNVFRKRILNVNDNELNNSPDSKLRNNWNILFNEWQLLDETDYDLSKQEDKNIYVSDWQMIN